MKQGMFLVLFVATALMLTACSGEADNYNSYAHIQAYRVENLNYGSDIDPLLKIIHFTAITREGDTLTYDNFDSVKVVNVGVEAPQGNLMYEGKRGANGKYPYAVAYLVLGNAYAMRSQERW